MAKYERRLNGNFDEISMKIENEILAASSSATLEDETWFRSSDSRCAVKVFERYSAFGGNRVSLTVTIFEDKDAITVSGITSGGSQAIFLKMNTLGDETFLNLFQIIVDSL